MSGNSPRTNIFEKVVRVDKGLERPNRRVKLKRGCKDDLKVWWELKKNTLMENVSSWVKSF